MDRRGTAPTQQARLQLLWLPEARPSLCLDVLSVSVHVSTMSSVFSGLVLSRINVTLVVHHAGLLLGQMALYCPPG